eukprot:6175667-Pleurochrysis_carterae.AAC.1
MNLHHSKTRNNDHLCRANSCKRLNRALRAWRPTSIAGRAQAGAGSGAGAGAGAGGSHPRKRRRINKRRLGTFVSRLHRRKN